jgi:hypothetical protein
MSKWNGSNNCYSYAVGYSCKWLLIKSSHPDSVDELLERNPNFRLVQRQDLVLGKEYIAYRYGCRDWHFAKRGKDGHWRHKMGGTKVKPVSTKEIFAKEWRMGPNIYNSKLYLFEVQ